MTTTQKILDPVPGERRGELTFASLIQEGMSSNLYLAWHHRYWSVIICKMMRAAERDDKRWRELLLNEGRILEELNHPGIVRPYEVNSEAPLPYILLEYLPGATVRQVLRDKGRFAVQDAIRLTMYLGSSLVFVHKGGYVHRDIKPSNVMLHAGRIKLFDFGVAWPIGKKPPDKSGTPMYLAPEQCLQQALTPATDIWALGIFLFELLTGQLPFPDSDYHNYEATPEERYSQLVVPPRSVKEAGRRIPARLQAFLNKCLAFDPLDRFASMEECLIALDPLCQTKIWPTRRTVDGLIPDLATFTDGQAN